MNIKKAYYYLFYTLYNFGMFISDDFLREWKPLLTIVLLEIFLLGQGLVWYVIITKEDITFVNPRLVITPIVATIAIANYFFFLHNDKWKNYVTEFRTLDRQKGNIGRWIVFLLIVLIGSGLVFSFIRLSQIDWVKYR